MGLTTKQRSLMGVIVAGNDDGTHLDIDQILEALPYTTSKQSLQFSLRALVEKDCIQKMPTETRRGRARVVYAATAYGNSFFMAEHKEVSTDTEIDAPDVDTAVEVPDVYLGLGIEPE